MDAFTDYWLDLRKIDDTSPSTTLYNDYELDEPLKAAALEETRLYVARMFHENLPARVIVDSDFSFLNERLATHYQIPGVMGAEMRLVKLPERSLRGGLMTQASVLKVTANGTTTSPVIRGNWIAERVLGVRVAPPPSVPAVEPDIRGAVTIRQQLEQHRNDPSCAACHARLTHLAWRSKRSMSWEDFESVTAPLTIRSHKPRSGAERSSVCLSLRATGGHGRYDAGWQTHLKMCGI